MTLASGCLPPASPSWPLFPVSLGLIHSTAPLMTSHNADEATRRYRGRSTDADITTDRDRDGDDRDQSCALERKLEQAAGITILSCRQPAFAIEVHVPGLQHHAALHSQQVNNHKCLSQSPPLFKIEGVHSSILASSRSPP